MIKKILFFIVFVFALSQPAYATVGTTAQTSIQYGTGSQNIFYVNFIPDNINAIQVIYTDSTGKQTTLFPYQYLVTINATPLGQLWPTNFSITYPLSGSPIAVGTSLTISRILPLIQGTTLANQGSFNPQVVEQALDLNEMQLQQISARTGLLRGSWITGTAYNFGDIVVDGVNGNNTGNLYVCAQSNTSSVWATDLSAGDWSLSLNVQGIVNSTPSITNNYVYANISGSSAQPYGVSVSALLDSAIGNTEGDVLYRSGSAWSALAPGTSGQVLTTFGAGSNPAWSSVVGSGTVTSVATANGITGGPITGSGTVGLATVANNALLANTSGITAAPSATTMSAYLDSVFGSSQGEIIYRAGSTWVALAPGTAGQVLQTGGAAANPQWAAATSGLSSCTTVSVSTSGANSITASCAGGYTLTGGGCTSTGNMAQSYPSASTTWTCTGSSLSNTAYAVCCH